ncbi:hypothetical protein [Methanocella arvoryzae]|nr:hypothetical protein [Methanocella arvoryzae]
MVPLAGINLSIDNILIANGFDNIPITARVTDARGRPAPDGTEVIFTVGGDEWDAFKNGSLSPNPAYVGRRSVTNKTSGGLTTAYFGWVNSSSAGDNMTIIASCEMEPGVNKSILVTPYKAFAVCGIVEDSNGRPLVEKPVTLHLMDGNASGESREVYNVTTMSRSDPGMEGWYIFDNLPLSPEVTYSYLDARADVGDGVTYYGRSGNLSLKYEGAYKVAQTRIVLQIPDKGPFMIPENSHPDPDYTSITLDITTNNSSEPKYYFSGGVQDLNGRPYGNATVTLHVLVTDSPGLERELYTLTLITSSDPPYPGAYAFIVPRYPNMTGAYATAEATTHEGIRVYGTSDKDDHPHVKCRHMHGFIMLHGEMPG